MNSRIILGQKSTFLGIKKNALVNSRKTYTLNVVVFGRGELATVPHSQVKHKELIGVDEPDRPVDVSDLDAGRLFVRVLAERGRLVQT